MLSKIEFFENLAVHHDFIAERERILPVLRRHLQSSYGEVVLTPAPGGTLGICIDAKIAGKRRFLKTHHPSAQARASLVKEADILLRIYGKAVLLDCFEIFLTNGATRLCLLMPTFAPLAAPLQPTAAVTMASKWNAQINGHWPKKLTLFEQYLKCADRALARLSDLDLLETESIADAQRLIAQLENRLTRLPRALSHGDFGPKNIMVHDAELLAIDWEDAFWGISGYDYLYWLTFMENRPFLHNEAFGRTGLEPNDERAILTLIVLLKSYLSVCSGSYLGHSISIQDRMAEILKLPT